MNHSLYWKQNRIKHGLPSFENSFQISAHRFDEKRHDKNKESSLKCIRAHVRFFGRNTDATSKRAASLSPVDSQKPERSCCYSLRCFRLFKAFFSKTISTVSSVTKSTRVSKRSKKSSIGD